MAIGEVIMSSKRYTEDFKIEAVRQVVDRGYSIAEVADRLGTTTHSLYVWKKKYGPGALLKAPCDVVGSPGSETLL
jgi:transposase